MFSVILLAGGLGSRMKSEEAKQILPLGDKAIAHHSLDVFLSMPEVLEIIVVCDIQLRRHFEAYKNLKWAEPGFRRQDSAYHGLQKVDPSSPYVCIHDACRPFITQSLVKRVVSAAHEHGASAAGMPLKFTIKEAAFDGIVVKTPDRSRYWEIQTPQVIRTSLLKKGYEKALSEDLTVTDDVSLIELMGEAVKLVEGAYSNIKITTQDDMAAAHVLLKKHE